MIYVSLIIAVGVIALTYPSEKKTCERYANEKLKQQETHRER